MCITNVEFQKSMKKMYKMQFQVLKQGTMTVPLFQVFSLVRLVDLTHT